jgi:hypothetical protein
VWVGHHWRCSRCGHRSTRRHLSRHSGCQALQRTSATLHPSHRIMLSSHVAGRVHIPLMHCQTC